jgi:hypothetical protein
MSVTIISWTVIAVILILAVIVFWPKKVELAKEVDETPVSKPKKAKKRKKN